MKLTMRALDAHAAVILDQYRSGLTPKQIAVNFGCATGTIRNWLRRSGEPLRSTSEAQRLRVSLMTPDERRHLTMAALNAPSGVRRFDLDANAQSIASDYRNGVSIRDLARKWNCSQPTIHRILTGTNEPVRSLSEAGVLRASREDESVIAKRVAAARAVTLGRRMSDSARHQTAIGHEVGKQLVGEFEEELAATLHRRGLQVCSQLAVDRYNLDLALHPFAIEVHNTLHRPTIRPHIRKRIKDLFDRGWHVIYVWHYGAGWGGPFDFEYVADQIIALMNQFSSDPTAPRQYAVICSDGHNPATRRTKRNHRASERSTGDVTDSSS